MLSLLVVKAGISIEKQEAVDGVVPLARLACAAVPATNRKIQPNGPEAKAEQRMDLFSHPFRIS